MPSAAAKAKSAHRCPSNPYSDEERAEIIAFVLVKVASGVFVSRVFKDHETTTNGVRLPNPETFWRWIFEDDMLPQMAAKPGDEVSQGLSNKLVRARESGIEALLDECIDIADETASNEDADRAVVQRSRLRVDTRIKLAQMLKPKSYSPKLDVTTGGEKIQSVPQTIEAMRRRVAEGMKEIDQGDDE